MERELAIFWSTVLMTLPAVAIGLAIRKARGTTLVAPLVWALLSYLALMLSVLTQQLRNAPTPENWAYMAATTALCPIVALFGAKRPQSRAWQFIVASFWFVAALPAIQFLVVRPGETLDLHSVWKWFLTILILVGGANYLPTRFAWASILVTIGQTILLWNYLPAIFSSPRPVDPGLGVLALMLGIALAFWKQRRSLQRLGQYHGWNRVWLDFRDFYGAVWALRIMERINSLAPGLETGVRLYWDGFYEVLPVAERELDVAADGQAALPAAPSPDSNSVEFRPASPQALTPLDAALRSLLRRFVSNEWLDIRLGKVPNQRD